ncbi:helix-turn-helix domain-containing protein [Candidatus Omnitrophota bacterium]
MSKEKDTAPSRGESLMKLRKAKGLSLEQVHQKTKIHVRVLKALEEDRMEGISSAYLKGLLKIYCNLLGVDPKDFMEFTQKSPQAQQQQEPEEEQPRQPPPKAAEESLELPLPRSEIRLPAIGEQLKLKPIFFSVFLLILAILAFKIGKGISVRRRAALPQESSVSEPVVSRQAEVIPLALTTGKPRLGILAKQDCWLEVKTNGKTIFRGVLKKGEFELWEAKERIEFTLGNAGGVDVEVNNKLLPALGRRGQVIRDILVTKDGLKVPE